MTSTPGWVYRVYDKDRQLLYVGCSVNPRVRLGEHATHARWWPEARHIDIARYPNSDRARQAEARAIEKEHPAHNIMNPAKWAYTWQIIETERQAGRTWKQIAAILGVTEGAVTRRVARRRKEGTSTV